MKLVLPARTFLNRYVRLPMLLAACLLVTAVVVEPVSAGVLKTQQSCQKNVSKSGRKYLSSVVKTLSKCRESELSGKQPSACDEARTIGSLQKAADTLSAKISRGCGGLSTAELVDPRPRGLAFGRLVSLLSRQQAEHERLARHLVDLVYGQRDAAQPAYGKEAMSCQKTLGKGTAKQLKNAIKGLGSRCADRVDRGGIVEGDAFRSVEGCLQTAADALASYAERGAAKISKKCDDQSVAGLRACGQDSSAGQTVAGLTGCLFDRAVGVAASALELEHAGGGSVVKGTLGVADVAGEGDTLRPADATVLLVDPGSADTILVSGETDSFGQFSFNVQAYRSYRLCWEKEGQQSCAAEDFEATRGSLNLPDQDLTAPRGAGSTLVYGKVLRADGTACYRRYNGSDPIFRGGASLLAATGGQVAARVEVGSDGSYMLLAPSAGDYIVVADCGDETSTAAVSAAGGGGVLREDLRMISAGPVPGSLVVTDADGNVITDPLQVIEGDELFVQVDFGSANPGDLEYHWTVTRGEGEVLSPSGPGRSSQACIDPLLGNFAKWIPKGIGKIQQLVVSAKNNYGGLSSAAITFGPLDPSELFVYDPCLFELKDEDTLCGDGYINSGGNNVPEPAGGRKEFLTEKYRGSSNSKNDACLYYNLVDPDCVDLDCDGALDPGSDPDGKCSRLTLGDWWTKNGFDPVTGLGTDVVSAWYLNSNDLGFGREMHCRVTSYSPYLLAKILTGASGLALPVSGRAADDSYPMASDLYLDNTWLEDLSLEVPDYMKLFRGYPATVACYVVNYTTDFCNNYPTNLSQNADLAYEGQQQIEANPGVNPTHAYGTVAMEFSPVEGFGELGPVTKFFVYDGRTASGTRLGAANLDGCGAKSVPEVCMSCHGGDWPGDGNQGAELDAIIAGLTDNVNCELAGIGIATPGDIADPAWIKRRDLLAQITLDGSKYSSFLPFDPKTYVFPPDHLAVASEGEQEDNMRALNEMVKYTKPTQAIQDIVGGWYNNNFSSGSFTAWRPTDWNNDASTPENEADFYDNVYAVSCRGCHAAHLSVNSADALVLFGPGRVCENSGGTAGNFSSNGPTMAHAKLTYQNFWRGEFPQDNALTSLEDYFQLKNNDPSLSCD